MKAKIVAIANQKGGVAKTTSTLNLATVKAMQDKKVLMVDLDPQASLTISCGFEPGEGECAQSNICTILQPFVTREQIAESCITVDTINKEINKENLYLVSSSIDLAWVERSLVSGRNSDVQLRKALKVLEEYFDYIFIDCPPQLGTLLTNALTAADELIVPVKTDYLAYRGMKALMDTIEGIKSGDGDRSLNPELEVVGIIATMYKTVSNDHKDVLALLRDKYKVLGVIKDSVEVNKKVIDGLPVVLNTRSDAGKEYKKIAKSI